MKGGSFIGKGELSEEKVLAGAGIKENGERGLTTRFIRVTRIMRVAREGEDEFQRIRCAAKCDD